MYWSLEKLLPIIIIMCWPCVCHRIANGQIVEKNALNHRCHVTILCSWLLTPVMEESRACKVRALEHLLNLLYIQLFLYLMISCACCFSYEPFDSMAPSKNVVKITIQCVTSAKCVQCHAFNTLTLTNISTKIIISQVLITVGSFP